LTDDCKQKAKVLADRLNKKHETDSERQTKKLESNHAKELEKLETSKNADCKRDLQIQKTKMTNECKTNTSKL